MDKNHSSMFPATALHIHEAKDHPRAPTEVSGPAASLESSVDELIGTRLGVYQIEAFLGAGAMGRVYLARHVDLHRYCALKILPPNLALRDSDYVKRFLNEGRATAALVHPNIVTTHAIGCEGGYNYLEMEFIAGLSLQHTVRAEGPLAPLRAVSITARLADGLGAAHAAKILHRDLKPENVLLTHQGIPKIADFGLAKQVVVSRDGTDRDDAPYELVGTPAFMAPELFLGEPASVQSDLYSLGVCLFVQLTGRVPFDGTSTDEIIRAASSQKIPSIRTLNPHVPLEISECVHVLLEKSPANRPRTAIQAQQLLDAVAGQTEDLQSLLSQAFRGHSDVEWHADGPGERFRVTVRLPHGRHQSAFVEPSAHAAADRLLTISSVCCPAVAAYFESALRLNSEILHGGLAIRDIDGEACFVMHDTYPRATVDAEEIRRSVLEIAHRADAIEKLLTGRDVH